MRVMRSKREIKEGKQREGVNKTWVNAHLAGRPERLSLESKQTPLLSTRGVFTVPLLGENQNKQCFQLVSNLIKTIP